MPIDFKAARGELHFQANYTEPFFELWQRPDRLFKTLFTTFAKHGMHLNDVKWGPATSVGEVDLTFHLLNFALTVHIRVDRVEIDAFDICRVNEQLLQEVGVELFDALKTYNSSVSFAAYVVALAHHGTLSTGTAREFTHKLIGSMPEILGPVTGSGMVLYYGPGEDRLSSAVTLDLSAVVSDALFVRVHTVWDASRVRLEDLAARTRQYWERVFKALNLNPLAGK
jgi:hypothetical protein